MQTASFSGAGDLAQVCALAQQAGDAILTLYRRAADGQDGVVEKADRSPLTAADLCADRVICAGLARLAPGVRVVSEERPDSQAQGRTRGEFWLVDPLDGTKEFLSRNGEFTVNIALVRDGEPVWGVVHAPALGQTYWGGRLHGAFRSQWGRTERIQVRAGTPDAGLRRVVASRSHLNPETARFIAELGNSELVYAGSSLKFCRVAEGSADLYPRLAPTFEWDTAAAQAVVEGAGGHVCNLEGERLRYGKGDLLNPSFVASSGPFTRGHRE